MHRRRSEVQTVESWTPVDPLNLVTMKTCGPRRDQERATSCSLHAARELRSAPCPASIPAPPTEITKKQAEQVITAWIDDGLRRNVEFKDDKSRTQQGLGIP